MKPYDIERLERSVLSLVVQAMRDYWEEAVIIFREETDMPQDIAEDITREAIASMGVSGTQDRLYGKVDVKKAIYVFLPEAIPVALMLDAKAEKPSSTATIQMSQTSMRVRQERAGKLFDEQGKLDTVIHRGNRKYRVVTIISKFEYLEIDGNRSLNRIIVCCIPSGELQDRYNPTAKDTIWLAGRDAPSLGEDFRVRISYEKLKAKADWRVQTVSTA